MKTSNNKSERNPLFLYGIYLGMAFINSVAILSVYAPNNFVASGMTGAAMLVSSGTALPVWAANIMLNFPIICLAIYVNGFHLVTRAIFAEMAVTVLLAVLPPFTLPACNIWLLASVGGACMGFATGTVVSFGGSFAGTGLLAYTVHKKCPRISIGTVDFLFNGAIIIIAAATRGIYIGIITIFAQLVCDIVIDLTRKGWKSLHIICN